MQTVELSAQFLGNITLLQWACSQAAAGSCNPSHHHLPLSMSEAFSRVSHFPVRLNLVRQRQDGGPLTTKITTSEGAGGSEFGPPEKTDWGALVSHCYSQYWSILSLYLKWAYGGNHTSTTDTNKDSGSESADYCDQKGSDLKEEQSATATATAIGSPDVSAVLGCLLESADAAGESVGVVVESVSALLPEVSQFYFQRKFCQGQKFFHSGLLISHCAASLVAAE